MKIVKQSFEILPELNDPIKQIASRARICYKSEDKAKNDERPFLERIRKHEPIFEMATVTLLIEFDDPELYMAWGGVLNGSKYLNVCANEPEELLVSGSVRAWQEYLKSLGSTGTTHRYLINAVLTDYNEFLFPPLEDVLVLDSAVKNAVNIVISTNFDSLALPNNYIKMHTYVAIKFITNRAVSHELVRHRPVSFLQESQRYCRYKNEVVFIDPKPAFPIFRSANEFDTQAFQLWYDACEQSEFMYLELLKKNVSPQAARTVLPNSCKTEIIVYCNLLEWEHIFERRLSKAAEPSMREIMIPLYKEFKTLYDDLGFEPKLSVG